MDRKMNKTAETIRYIHGASDKCLIPSALTAKDRCTVKKTNPVEYSQYVPARPNILVIGRQNLCFCHE